MALIVSACDGVNLDKNGCQYLLSSTNKYNKVEHKKIINIWVIYQSIAQSVLEIRHSRGRKVASGKYQ